MTYKILVSKDKSGGQHAFGKLFPIDDNWEIFPNASPTLFNERTTYERLKEEFKNCTVFADLENYTLEEVRLYMSKDEVIYGIEGISGPTFVRGDHDSIKKLQEKLIMMSTMYTPDKVLEMTTKVVDNTRKMIIDIIEAQLDRPYLGMSIGETNAYKTACITILSLIQAQDNEKTSKQRLQQSPGKKSSPEEDFGTSK